MILNIVNPKDWPHLAISKIKKENDTSEKVVGGCSAMVGKTAWLAQTATLTDFICNSAH